jgi:hypothetical protein
LSECASSSVPSTSTSSSPSACAPACQARPRAWARAARSPARPSSSAATCSTTRQAVAVEATGPNSSGWSRRTARSLRQSPPSASITARSRSTAPTSWRRRGVWPRPARHDSAALSSSRSASSASSVAPAWLTTPSPSQVTSKRGRELVACTRKVPSLAGGCDLDSRILPAQEGTCVRKPVRSSLARKAEANQRPVRLSWVLKPTSWVACAE